MSTALRSRTARRGYWAAGTALAALALGGVLAPSAFAATTRPDYTIVAAVLDGALPIDNSTFAFGQPALVNQLNVSVTISPDGKTEYLLKKGEPGSPVDPPSPGTVTQANLAAATAGTPIDVRWDANSMALSPDGKLAYVVNGNGLDPLRTSDPSAPGTAVTPVPLDGGPAGPRSH